MSRWHLRKRLARRLRGPDWGGPPEPKTLSTWERILALQGQVSHREAEALANLAKVVPKHRCIVEIGSFRGQSTSALAYGAHTGHGATVYAVEPHMPFVGPKGGHYGPQDRPHFYANLVSLEVAQHVALVSLPSVDAAKGWGYGSCVELLFVDGDHRYASVKQDVESWLPHMVAGALVAFHDMDHVDVERVVNELLARSIADPIRRVDHMMILQLR